MTSSPGELHDQTELSTAATRAEHLTKVYGSDQTQVVALDDVTVDLARGQFTAIMGPSGSGKSTLMHCLAGLDSVTSGRVFIGSADLTTLSDKELTRVRRDQVGFVFQAFNLLPTLTALENITLELRDRLGHRPAELSGGQQQRVACARALASRPQVIFADEPTGNLDSRSGTEVLSFLRSSVTDLHQTVVMVTHDPKAASYADRVIFLADGKVVQDMADPTTETVFEQMQSLDQVGRVTG